MRESGQSGAGGRLSGVTLRDQDGDIEVRIGDLFQIQTGAKGEHTATIEALFPDSRMGTFAEPVVCCRIYGGALLHEGKMGTPGDLFYCAGAIVAAGVRNFVSNGKPTPQPVPESRERTEPAGVKTRRAREAPRDQQSAEPTSYNLFD